MSVAMVVSLLGRVATHFEHGLVLFGGRLGAGAGFGLMVALRRFQAGAPSLPPVARGNEEMAVPCAPSHDTFGLRAEACTSS